MEEKVLEVKISVSDEGEVYIDNITADMQALDESIENNSILMHYDSKNGYETMFENYKAYLIDSGATIAEIHKKLDFVTFLYQNQQNLAKEAVGTVLKVIESASRILGTSMLKHIIKLLNV